jgi:hypothetical protein
MSESIEPSLSKGLDFEDCACPTIFVKPVPCAALEERCESALIDGEVIIQDEQFAAVL